MWDAAVVGAGPAGSTAARLLAARGHRVLLLERRPFPREKVCGDALLPDALAALERAGLLPQVLARARACRELEVVTPSGISVVLPVRSAALRRADLDALLADAAAAVGVKIRFAEVRAVEAREHQVALHLGTEEVRARAAVIATGADRSLLPGRTAPPSAVALRQYVRAPQGPDRLLVAFHRSVLPGYGWVFPLGQGWHNVGCGLFLERKRESAANLRRLYERFLEGFAPARTLLAGAVERTPVRGAPLRCGLRGAEEAAAGRVLAVGEAIGATFPFTGEGIGKAMETAERAAEVLDEALRGDRFHLLPGFGPALRAALGPRQDGYAAAERWVTRPFFGDLLGRCARRSGGLRARLAGVLEETVDPAGVLTPAGLLRSLLGRPV